MIIRNGRWRTGLSFVAKLFGATTFESAIQIQSEHAKTSYAGFIAYLMKMTELRANLAKEFFKPIETVVARVQSVRFWSEVQRVYAKPNLDVFAKLLFAEIPWNGVLKTQAFVSA